jgi:hypothetical protein
VLIVIPKLRGRSCGLADHAKVILKEAANLGLRATIHNWPGSFPVARETPILLEFTPLAYSSIGLPWVLLLQILQWRLRQCRIVTYFHEIPFTNGHTWKRDAAVLFQILFCIALAALSNEAVTNQISSVQWLSLLRKGKKVQFLPSFSNIGEREIVLKPCSRPHQVVIFGSPGKRRHAHDLVSRLGGYRKIFGNEIRVIDIGEPLILPALLRTEVESLGLLPTGRVLSYLANSRYGFFYSEPSQFSKSGVFGAYCATGVVPIIANSGSDCSPYFLSTEELVSNSPRAVNPDQVWVNCRRWFHRYSSKACTAQLCALLRV